MFKLKFLPARFGDAIWIAYGDPKKPHVLLVDGGTAGTRHTIQNELNKLDQRSPHLDLLVISHIDRDHIEGVLGLLEQGQPGFEVDDLWFNGLDHLGENLEGETLGVLQGERLSDSLKRLDWPWNAAFKHKAVCVPEIGALPSFTLSGGMKITLLAPGMQSLAELRPAWLKEVDEANLNPDKKLPANDHLLPEGGALDLEAVPDIEALADTAYQEDRSKANASSIAFLAEYQDKRLLLAADAHASAILAGLERIYPHGKVPLDVFKISHHGSKDTTSRELIEKIDCPCYVFSTNGSVFKHPHAESIARILQAGDAPLHLVFNYRSPQNQVWDRQDLKEKYGFTTRYPHDPDQGIEIELLSTPASTSKSSLVPRKKEDRLSFTQGHALIIGVGSYQNAPYANVPVVVGDAIAVSQVIKDADYCGYPDGQVEVISDAAATRTGILDALDRLARRTGESDTAFLFYCGHGALGTDGNYYLVSHDAEVDAGWVVPGSGVSEAELIAKLHAIPARRTLLIFNTCHSGSISPTLAPGTPEIKSRSLSEDTSAALLATGRGRIIITACREEQSSYVGSGKLTIFTQALVDGLHGKGVGNRAGYISAYSLYEQIFETVTEKTENAQEPELTVLKGVGPFAVALYKGARPLGEFDASQPIPKGPAVHQIKPEKAERAYTQIVQVRDGAVAIGDGAEAVGEGGISIKGNVGGDVIGAGGSKISDRSVAIGGDVKDSTIVTGDQHKVDTGGGAFVGGGVNTGGGDFVGRDQTILGDKVSGNKVEKHYHGPSGISPKVLRENYLNRVIEQTSFLSLTGVDPKAASDAKSQLSLSAVYTALLTLSSEEQQRLQRGEAFDKETRRLSALEKLNQQPRLVLLGEPGSGKSTFVNFVALCLAGEALGRPDANLALLTAPLPSEDEAPFKEAKEPQPQPWDHGSLLPVRITLRDFAARALPEPGQPASASHLWEFITQELTAASLAEYLPHLRQELLEKGGLLMLDGLDEVPDANRRREQICRVVTDFAATFGRCIILVTSRTYAYQQQDWRLPGFQEVVLAPFSSGQIRSFVRRWYAHIAEKRGLDPQNAQGRAQLLERAIFSSDRLRALAERPLILTLMASLHAWRGGSLPEKREQLYADTVDLLLDTWESQRVVRDAQGNVLMIQPSLVEWLKVDRDRVRQLLNQLAFQAHSTQPDLVGTANISEGQLVGELMRLSQNPDLNPVRLVEYLSQRAGLLLPHGVGFYIFPHRTFQEYLAACYLTDHDYPDQVAELARKDPNRWREVALLAGAKAGRGTASALWSLVEALCYQDLISARPDAADLWGAHLAGQALAETADLSQVSERHRQKVGRVQRWLVHILQGETLPATERARAGDSLATLGDPRFDENAWHLPKDPLLGFVRIPGGPFLMGSHPEKDTEAYEDEQPQHKVDLPEFYIARYPVTVAQFQAFVEASGHQPRDPDSLAGLPNHPAVWVTWFDALAYCRWLDERLRSWPETPEPLVSLLREQGWQVSLPSEAQWEKAARGTDGRLFPWDDQPDPEKANYGETGIGGTSAVGCFPGGASPYGVEDLSGNVLEWTRSLWGRSWEKPEFAYPYTVEDGREDLEARVEIRRVLRGGSFYFYHRFVRCASRNWLSPDHWDLFIGFRVVVSPSDSGARLLPPSR